VKPLEQGRVIAGRYRLDRMLAKGGMGCVWVGHHLQLDVGVAVKFMAPQLAASAEARARFEREAKASAQLRIANAVHIYDFGVEDDTPFLVMELLEGEDLEARLVREKRLAPAATRIVLDQVCRGLRRAHEVGLIHRDLKPANLFLARQGGEETVKILDFGIAKLTGPTLDTGATRTGHLLGSPHYMSPEQVRNTSKVDLRTDLWALGVIVFRCLTGQLPFPGTELGEVLVDVCTSPIPLASQVAPDLGPEVDRFFERALARDLAARFQTAAEVAEAFAAFVEAPRATAPRAELASLPSALPAPVTTPGAAPPPTGTLSPSSQTQRELSQSPKAARSTGLVVVIAGGALAAATVAAVVFWPGHAASPLPAAAASAAPASSAVQSFDAGASALDARPKPATESAPAAPSASVSAPPVKSPPGRNRPGPARKADDLLNHI
jgi:eukaryotic-like serine/threonine-protein kinase